jgi:hypothetical protein
MLPPYAMERMWGGGAKHRTDIQLRLLFSSQAGSGCKRFYLFAPAFRTITLEVDREIRDLKSLAPRIRKLDRIELQAPIGRTVS